MITTGFNWGNIRWEDFQKICIHLAQNIFKNVSFEEYLKQGHKQEGIDLISQIQQDGKYLTIQCKKEKAISATELKNIIAEFKRGQFFSSTTTFVLATTADLQTPSLQKELFEIKKQFIDDYKIKFHTWDRGFIEEQLKNHFTIVAYYFGLDIANTNCFNERRIPDSLTYSAVNNYINRFIRLHNENEDLQRWYWQKDNFIRLPKLMNNDRLHTKLICVIADAYQGKSLLLKQTAYELQNTTIPFKPLLIELKEFNIQHLKHILSLKYSEWKAIPAKDIVLLIDGLDEVPSDKFDEMVRYINEFNLEHPYVSIIFSCRKIFYKQYDIKSVLSKFTVYDLVELQEHDIENFIDNNLKSRSKGFKKEIKNINIGSILYQPFYLMNLVDNYKKNSGSIPKNKFAIIEKLIDNSLHVSKGRRLRDGYSVDQKYVKYRTAIQNLAFALQLAGLNAFSKEQVQLLFDETEIELLQHNTLVTSNENYWSFTNAMFQEHLAALQLSKLPYDDIIKFITVGNKIKKIKTKWIQTLASLLSILDRSNPTFEKLVAFIEQDNMELFFMTEHTKFDKEFRFTIIKKILASYGKQNLFPTLVDEPIIAAFINDLTEAKDYLFAFLSSTKHIGINCKISICRIIRYLTLNQKQKNDFLKVSIKQLITTSNTYYAHKILKVLAKQSIGDKQIIDKLLAINLSLNQSHEFRDGMYEWIIMLGFVDDYYSYGLDGLRFVVAHNKGIHHHGSEYAFEDFLLAAKSWKNIDILLQYIHSQEWQDYYTWHSLRKERFFNKLSKKLVKVFKIEPLLIFKIIDFLQTLERKHLREEFKEFDTFFTTTQSSLLISRMCCLDFFDNNKYFLSGFFTKTCFDYLFFELEEIIDPNKVVEILRQYIFELRYNQKKEEADLLYELAIAATEGFIIDKTPLQQDEYLKNEAIKKQNDLNCIQSLEAFKQALINFFKAYGKETIPNQDIYVDEKSTTVRKQMNANFLFHFLYHWHDRKRPISLNNSLELLERDGFFDFFRACEILDFNFSKTNDENVLIDILNAFYKEKIVVANFKNCLWIEAGSFHYKTMEKLLGKIFRQFGFETPLEQMLDLVWLDQSCTRLFKKRQIETNSNELSISEMILERLDEYEKEDFKQKIIENLNAGIQLETVLGTHIALCKELKIWEAQSLIFNLIEKDGFNDLYMDDLIETYLVLNGNKDDLVSVLLNYKHYDSFKYGYLVKSLIKSHSKQIVSSLLECIKCTNAKNETKITMAKYLCSLGYFEGFLYLTAFIRKEKKSPFTSQSGDAVHNVNTVKGLHEITDLVYYMVDTRYAKESSFGSVKGILVEWIKGFASKSEEDLNLVVTWLLDRQKELVNSFQQSADFFWYARTVMENFRSTDTSMKDFHQIKKVIKSLSN